MTESGEGGADVPANDAATWTVRAWMQTEGGDFAPWGPVPLDVTPEVTSIPGGDPSRDDADDADDDDASTFDASAYYSRLRTRRDGRALLTARELPSTQCLIGDNAATSPGSLPPGAVCVADAQASGKGRGGNAWTSPPGCLMFSLLTRHREGRTLPFVQYVATMAAVDAIQESADDALVAAGAKGHRRGTGSAVDAKIKWPNDLYSGGLKIGGVLCTSTYSDGGFDVVVGVGINLDNAEPTTCVNDIVRNRLEREGLPSSSAAPVPRDFGSAQKYRRPSCAVIITADGSSPLSAARSAGDNGTAADSDPSATTKASSSSSEKENSLATMGSGLGVPACAPRATHDSASASASHRVAPARDILAAPAISTEAR